MNKKFAINSQDERALNTPKDTLRVYSARMFSLHAIVFISFHKSRVLYEGMVDRISLAFWNLCVFVFGKWLCLSAVCHMNPSILMCLFFHQRRKKRGDSCDRKKLELQTQFNSQFVIGSTGISNWIRSSLSVSVCVCFVQDFSALPSAATAAGVIEFCLSSKFSDIFVLQFALWDSMTTMKRKQKFCSACQFTLITSLDFHHQNKCRRKKILLQYSHLFFKLFYRFSQAIAFSWYKF